MKEGSPIKTCQNKITISDILDLGNVSVDILSMQKSLRQGMPIIETVSGIPARGYFPMYPYLAGIDLFGLSRLVEIQKEDFVFIRTSEGLDLGNFQVTDVSPERVSVKEYRL